MAERSTAAAAGGGGGGVDHTEESGGVLSVTRIKDQAMEGLGGALRDLIPSDDVKAYHPKYFYPLALSISLGMLAVFVGLFIPSFFNELGNQYLSPAGVDQPANCNDVPVSHTGTFTAAQNGYWAGSNMYYYSNTTYSFTMANRLYSPASFQRDMSIIQDILEEYGNYSSHNGLGVVLTYWMSFVILPDPDNPAQRFNLMSDPRNIFARDTIVGTVGSNQGVCWPNSSTTSFQTSDGLLSWTLNPEDIETENACNSTIIPSLFGYHPLLNNNKVVLSVDIRALITSYAINIGVMELIEVEEVIGSRRAFHDAYGIAYTIANYYDPRYPNMQYITCLTNVSAPLCIVILGTVVALPFFRHIGNSTYWPIVCNCSNPKMGDLTDPNHPCHRFSLFASLLFYQTGSASAILELLTRYTMSEVFDRTYTGMFLSSALGPASPNSSDLYSETMRDEAFDWCRSDTFGDCIFLTFTALDDARVDYTVNGYYYQLRNGACRDTLTTSKENWQKLIDQPFSTLTEDYVVCRETLYNALINSVGVSSGNLSLLTPLIVLFFVMLVSGYQRCVGKRWPQGYHPDQKDEVLDEFATILLLLRDNKLENPYLASSSQEVHKLQISRLSKELRLLSKQVAKQYEERPEESEEEELLALCCCSQWCGGCMQPNRPGENRNGTQEGLGSDTIETHYGHYNVIPHGVPVGSESEETFV